MLDHNLDVVLNNGHDRCNMLDIDIALVDKVSTEHIAGVEVVILVHVDFILLYVEVLYVDLNEQND